MEFPLCASEFSAGGLWFPLGHTQCFYHLLHSCIGEGNGNPLQCSCLENPRDWGAWWAAVYGVAQSRTRLKRLSSSSSNACSAGHHFAGLGFMPHFLLGNMPAIYVGATREWYWLSLWPNFTTLCISSVLCICSFSLL